MKLLIFRGDNACHFARNIMRKLATYDICHVNNGLWKWIQLKARGALGMENYGNGKFAVSWVWTELELNIFKIFQKEYERFVKQDRSCCSFAWQKCEVQIDEMLAFCHTLLFVFCFIAIVIVAIWMGIIEVNSGNYRIRGGSFLIPYIIICKWIKIASPS